jgi:hypothetical protein
LRMSTMSLADIDKDDLGSRSREANKL